MRNTIAFQTGRAYTQYGQRIAARRLESGIVAMVDIDRQIDYLLPADTELTERGVMTAYDNNREVYGSDSGMTWEQISATYNELRDLAREVWCI